MIIIIILNIITSLILYLYYMKMQFILDKLEELEDRLDCNDYLKELKGTKSWEKIKKEEKI